MPPGSKKRRAAKKKMENQSNPSSPAAHSHGNEFVEHHDEKHNDVGEVNSPGSQDHHNPSAEGLVVNDSVVHVERDFKIEGKSVRKNGRGFEHDESMMKSYNVMSFSSSGNSSDDEIHGIMDSRATEDKKITLYESSVEAIQSVLIEEVEQVKVESLLDEENEKNPSYDESKVGASLDKNEKVIVQSVEETAVILEQNVYATQETDDRLTLPFDNGVEQEKECAVTEPLLVPSPFPEKKTSWRSCCELFDVFLGSGR